MSEITLPDEDDDESETLLVVTTVERPYVMIREGAEGNEAFDGFAIDLLKAISKYLKFKVESSGLQIASEVV